MRVIAVGSGKGGVGRSTITANLGVALAELGRSTLIIDGSITSPNQAIFFGLEKSFRMLNDVLMGSTSIDDAVYKGPSGVRVLPAAVTLEKIRKAEPSRLPELVNEHVEGYDFVLIDTPNGLRKETVSALKAGRELLLVTIPELTAVSDSMKTKVAGGFLGLETIGLVLNQVKGKEHELAEEEISGIMNLPILSEIPYDKEVRKSLNEGKLLLERSPDSPAAEKIKELGEELAKGS